MTIVEMQVHMDCSGCENKIKKALKKLKGVDDIDVDINMQKVTVMGWAKQEKVLRAVRRTGRTAELWPYPYNPEYGHNLNVQYYQQHQPRDGHEHHHHHHHHDHQSKHKITTYNSIPNYSSYSYNYYKHGYSGKEHGYYQPPPYSTMFNEQDTAVFSDENPHACSIM
ncbi:putative heavy metal-associated domain, HMA [Rosa chinensis]|uniref:Putative heavy metal-associated domain, HMA n=1 Tax=Rosa chinensis TaxID=74649 RepID=A0A2P6Q4Q1_ROSCH|nr:heavy metal-associated isoprenylated plant protein 29 [Rosa chinensis]PRQ29146.1 putative heavy metal-associated domain, HMA [Rosa chinensis]